MRFPLEHHYNMLSDKERNTKYQEAIEKVVQDHDFVVDIGSGTGVLSHFSKQAGANKVVAIEYFKEVADFSEKLSKSKFDVLNLSSWKSELESPSIVVTETIGSVGLEELIVEICRDFKSRHTSVRHFIPSQISINCRFFSSPQVDLYLEDHVKIFSEALGFGGNENSTIESEVVKIMCSQINEVEIKEKIKSSNEITLSNFVLGESPSSYFSQVISVPKGYRALEIYFNAEMAKGIELSSSTDCTSTHWKNTFVLVPDSANEVSITFEPKQREFYFDWR